MKVVDIKSIENTDRHVKGEGFESLRVLLRSDNMGFGIHKTIIPKGGPYHWHYKNHLEACYCIKGKGELTNLETGEKFTIDVDTTYVLDNNDDHTFEALEDVVLISVFNPPVTGKEVHTEDGSYAGYSSPVYNVMSVPLEDIKSNDYNPNSVAPPEMELLTTSIREDGYTQPVVCYPDDENPGKFIVVDGFHRYRVLKETPDILEREGGRLPIVVIKKGMSDRMASTIRHNRARGSHNIELMSNIVAELVEMGKGDAWICKHIGMGKDELLRLKQITGIAALFKNQDFSNAWNAEYA